MELRDALQRIALQFPSSAGRAMTEELKRRGWGGVNHKRVYRRMRKDKLLCLRRRQFVVTTESAMPCRCPNLARQMTLTGLNQLWVADITCLRLRIEFVYLAVILDAFSRRVEDIRISMSRKANPYDNAKAESFMKTLKTRRPIAI